MAFVKRKRGDGFPPKGNFFDLDPFMDFFTDRWSKTTTPATNIKETEESYEIQVAALGMTRKDFDVDVSNGALTISAEREETDEEKEENYTRREYNYNSFSRTFQLPESVKEDEIKAKYENGVLKLTVPKKEEAKTKPRKKIEIG